LVEGVILALIVEVGRLGGGILVEAEALEADRVGHALVEIFLHVGKVDAIVGALGARE